MKWKEKKAVGDVVLVAELNQPRGACPLERIVLTHPGKHEMVQAVTVQYFTQNREFKRAITKLCLLEEAEG